MSDIVDESVGGSSSSVGLGAEEGFAGDVPLGDSSRVVTARGTEDGLVLRIDGKAEWSTVIADLEFFLGERKRFFQGGQVSIEWIERLPTKEQSLELETLLKDSYGMEISTRKKQQDKSSEPEAGAQQKSGVTIRLFNEVEENTAEADSSRSLASQVTSEQFEVRGNMRDDGFPPDEQLEIDPLDQSLEDPAKKYVSRMARILGEDVLYEDDANAKVVFGTLRSGQRLETPFSLIVVGDVNPGADLVAGGDIIVLGSLRGTAHASAYDDEALDKVIISLQMQPMQLRIGSVISRGSDEVVSGAEIARIENRRIIVEAYSARALMNKRFR